MHLPRMFRQWRLPTLLLRFLAIISLFVSLFGSGTQVFAACTINGTVYRDYNANGVQDAQEPGVPDITVTAYSAAAAVASAQSGATGAYMLNVGAAVPNGDEVRIEFSGLPDYLRSGPFGAESDTTVTFVTCTGAVAGVDLGTANPGQYCNTPNPDLATPCFAPGDPSNPAVAGESALVSFPYQAGAPNGSPIGAYDVPPDTVEATIGDLGSVFGLAYMRTTDDFFLSAFLKRHVGYGPGGPGAIYRVERSTGTVSVFATVPNVGAIVRPTNGTYVSDINAFANVGKMSLGELDISEDDSTLYTVNLNTRALVRINIAAGGLSSFAIPTGGCTGGEFRPFGLGIHDFMVYVGGVCDASASQDAADLDARVYVFNPNSNTFNPTPVLTFDLDYPRRCADGAPPPCGGGNARSAIWHPWRDTWLPPDGTIVVYPQPILADIEFDDGNMILGLRDRAGDQTGNEAYNLTTGDTTLYLGIPAGDILRACGSPQTGWTLENGADCGGVQTNGNTAPFDLQGPGSGEFYWEDNNAPLPAERHDEITLGGVFQLPGSPDVASVAFDPVPDDGQLFDAGVIWLSNTQGTRTRSYRIYNGSPGAPNVYGKANGLGSLEATCGPAPLEIGNRVWEDLDLNGRQDPGELPLANVTLQLWLDTDGDNVGDKFLASTVTNAAGEYYFNAANVFDPTDLDTFDDIDGDGVRDPNEPAGIMPDRTYEIRVDGGANYGAGGVLSLYFATTFNQGGAPSDMRDSDGVNPSPLQLVDPANFPRAIVNTGQFGDNDHTWDFGFALQPPPRLTPTPSSGQPGPTLRAELSKTVNPPFAQPGDTVTWTITATNPNHVPLTNAQVTDTMPGEVEIQSVSASAGSASFSGQTVRWTMAVMPPNSSVTITVVTRVRDNAAVPFNISNQAQFVSSEVPPLFASANVVSAAGLPGTGESPWSRWRLPIFALAGVVIVLAAAWVIRRARR